jgi:hypothetical protein
MLVFHKHLAHVYSATLSEVKASHITMISPSESANHHYRTTRTSIGAFKCRVVVEDGGESDWMASPASLRAFPHRNITGFRATHSQPKSSYVCIALAKENILSTSHPTQAHLNNVSHSE